MEETRFKRDSIFALLVAFCVDHVPSKLAAYLLRVRRRFVFRLALFHPMSHLLFAWLRCLVHDFLAKDETQCKKPQDFDVFAALT